MVSDACIIQILLHSVRGIFVFIVLLNDPTRRPEDRIPLYDQ